MFAENEKISARQLFRSYAMLLTVQSALLIPASADGEYLGTVLLAQALLGLLLLWTVRTPKPEMLLLRGLCYLHAWLLGTLLIRETGLLIREFLLTETALWKILLCFYLMIFYNLYRGLECRARVGEILFPVILLLLGGLTVLMCREAEPQRLLEAFRRAPFGDGIPVLRGMGRLRDGYQLFCWLSAAQSLWQLQDQVQGRPGWGASVRSIWLWGAAASMLWAVFTYSIYGDNGHTGLAFPLASAMTLAHLPGNVIGRLDTVFVFCWVMGLFLMSSSLLALPKSGALTGRERYLSLALLAASFCAALDPELSIWGQRVLFLISTPAQLLILLLQTWRGRRGTDRKSTKGPTGARFGRRLRRALTFGALLFCTGCGQQELEERSLAERISVDVGETQAYRVTFGFGSADGRTTTFEAEAASLEEARECYVELFQKEPDFNHLKYFYFSEDLLGREDFFGLLEEIQGNPRFSRGVSVYIAAGTADALAQAEAEPKGGTPVHRLLNAWYNQESCRITAVTEDGRYKGTIFWPYSD